MSDGASSPSPLFTLSRTHVGKNSLSLLKSRPYKNFLIERNIAMINENAIANIFVDVKFLEDQFRDAGRANLVPLFAELRSVRPPSSQPLFKSTFFLLLIFFLTFFLMRKNPMCRQHQSCCQIRWPNTLCHHFAKRRSHTSNRKGSLHCSRN
jgi:hypothetical protein